MWLLLCEADDGDGPWAQRGLRERGLAPVELVTSDALVSARRWEHRVGENGASINVELADGRLIQGDRVHGVLNRLVAIPPAPLEHAAEPDRGYATQELYAFFLSWLHALPGRVVNRPSPQGLSGCWLERSEWLILAARAGLHTSAYRGASSAGLPPPGASRRGGDKRRHLIVVGERALGPPGVLAAVIGGCARLSQLVDAAILEVEFVVQHDGRWAFENATTLPLLRPGGERMLDLLASALTGRRSGR